MKTTQQIESTEVWRPFLLIAPICWLVYANSLGNQFVFDDLFTVVNNEAIRSFNLRTLITTWFRPVRDLSLVVDYWFWGLNPSGFHLTNILIHSLNSCFVYLLAHKLVGNIKTALFAALLFAVHPIQTDAVTYISGRRDVLFTFFYLVSLYSFIRFKKTQDRRYAIGSLIAFALSLLTKEMAATLPAIVLLWDLIDRWDAHAKLSVPKQLVLRIRDVIRANRWVFVAGGVVLVAVAVRYLGPGRGLGSTRVLRFEYWGGSAWTNFLTMLTVHLHYMKQLMAPLTLIASYQGAFPLAQSLFEWRVVLSLVALLALFGLFVYGLKRDRIISFALAFYFMTLLPVSQIIPHHELVAEHYLYLPMFGFALLVGRALTNVVERQQAWNWPIYIGFATVLILLSLRTVARNRDWKDAYTLWQATYQSVPNSPRAAYNFGVESLKRNQYAQSIEALTRAIQREPSHILAYNNLAVAYLGQGQYQSALNTLKQSLTLISTDKDHIVWGRRDQTYQMIFRNMAKSYLKLGQPDKALEVAQRVMRISETEPANQLLLASIQEQTNQIEPAIETCRKGVASNPNSTELRLTLARLLSSHQRVEEAVSQWQAVVKRVPTDPQANFCLAGYSQSQNNADAATAYLRSGLTQPLPQNQVDDFIKQAVAPYSGVRSFLIASQIYHLLQQSQQAISQCRLGLDQYPNDRELRNQLAFLYVDTKDIENALAQWQHVLQIYPNDYLANLNLGSYYMSQGDRQSAQRYLDLALANAPDATGQQQVQDLIHQIKQPQEAHP